MKATPDDILYHRPRRLREPDGPVQLYRVTRDTPLFGYIHHAGDRVAVTEAEARPELAEGRIEVVTPETEQAERERAAHRAELAAWAARNPGRQVPIIDGVNSTGWAAVAGRRG